MTTLYPKILEADWSFIDTWREEAALKAAEDIFYGGGAQHSDELEDLKQHAMLFCATHPKEIYDLETPYGLRRHLRRRLIQDFRDEWELARAQDHYGPEDELYVTTD